MNLHRRHVRPVIFEVVFWMLLGCFLTLFVMGLVADVLWVIIPAGLYITLLVEAGCIEPRIITSKVYRVSLEASARFRLVFISDFHAGAHKGRRFYQRLVARVNALDPDVIILGGDFVEDEIAGIEDLASFKNLRAAQGVYFLLGNHDFDDEPQCVRTTLVKWKLRDLTNRSVLLEKDGRTIELIGLDDAWRGKPYSQLVHRGASSPRIVLMHEPDGLLDLEAGQADLVLMGHTHGGQVRLPRIGALVPLPQQLPRSFDRGRKDWKGIPVIISQGVGETGTRMRFCCPPEMTVVEIE